MKPTTLRSIEPERPNWGPYHVVDLEDVCPGETYYLMVAGGLVATKIVVTKIQDERLFYRVVPRGIEESAYLQDLGLAPYMGGSEHDQPMWNGSNWLRFDA